MNGDFTKLRFGPYVLPSGYSIGDEMECKRCGRVTIRCLSDAPIPWFSSLAAGRLRLVLSGDLIQAVRTESAGAIAHHWGVSRETVRLWRRLLGVERMTLGTTGVWQELLPSRITNKDAQRGRRKSRSEKSRAKMIESKTGKPMHSKTRKALLRAVQKPKSEAHRAAMSRAHKTRGTVPPGGGRTWTTAEDKRLGTATDAVIAEKLNRSTIAIKRRRQHLGIPRYRRNDSKAQ
jgi:hypothetical protein